MLVIEASNKSKSKPRKSQERLSQCKSVKVFSCEKPRSQSRGSLVKLPYQLTHKTLVKPETTLNYQRRDHKNLRDKKKKRETSQTHLPINKDKKKIIRRKSTEKSASEEAEGKVALRATIEKVRHKIQGEKQ